MHRIYCSGASVLRICTTRQIFTSKFPPSSMRLFLIVIAPLVATLVVAGTGFTNLKENAKARVFRGSTPAIGPADRRLAPNGMIHEYLKDSHRSKKDKDRRRRYFLNHFSMFG
ncbi:hypothetical protein CCR75_004271 [Bremia lactucae]|uniref:Uncharacterized protein n=1 Tax=Bremia lactucae TaxID=4779 RepID=A0A976FJQ2_BRELC|nr:hypothetical protein CCR75_004271 [Bremia lactucae]